MHADAPQPLERERFLQAVPSLLQLALALARLLPPIEPSGPAPVAKARRRSELVLAFGKLTDADAPFHTASTATLAEGKHLVLFLCSQLQITGLTLVPCVLQSCAISSSRPIRHSGIQSCTTSSRASSRPCSSHIRSSILRRAECSIGLLEVIAE